MSTFTGLDDYDTLFAARHDRGALDPVPKVGEQIITTSLGIPLPKVGPELINPMERVIPIHGDVHPGQREQVFLTHETLKLQAVSPSSEKIGEGAAIFTDMMETILDVLDKQVATSPSSQQETKGLSLNDNQTEVIKSKEPKASPQKEDYPDSYLLWKITG